MPLNKFYDGLICGGLMCGETRYFRKLGCGNIFEPHSGKSLSLKLQIFCAFLYSRKFVD